MKAVMMVVDPVLSMVLAVFLSDACGGSCCPLKFLMHLQTKTWLIISMWVSSAT